MKIHDCIQRTPEWHAARAGVFTASDFAPFIVNSGKVADNARRKAILKNIRDTQEKDQWEIKEELAEERMMEYNIPVQRGNALEDEAREYYQAKTGNVVAQVGFITDDEGHIGCSPDGLIIGDNAVAIPACYIKGLEIKCPMPNTHLGWLLDGTLPEIHKYQVHGSMIVTGLSEWVFLSYCPGEAPLLLTVQRNTFTEELAAGLRNMVREKQEIKTILNKLWDAEFKPQPTP